MAADEYLEKIFAEAFKRELEADENVARSLPFFATTLALVASLLSYATTRMPVLATNALSVTMYTSLGLGSLGLLGVLWTLFEAVRAREYRLLPRETEQRTWTHQLRDFFAGQGLAGAALEDRVVEELRARMVIEYAEACEHNRLHNRRKYTARATGLTLLVIVLAIAFFMVATMFVATDRVSTSAHGAVDGPSPTASVPRDHARQSPTAAAAAAVRGRGR